MNKTHKDDGYWQKERKTQKVGNFGEWKKKCHYQLALSVTFHKHTELCVF